MSNIKIKSFVLRDLGVPAHILGNDYICKAIELCIQDKSYINSITKRLYPQISKWFETTPSRVERAIRHAVEISTLRIPMDTISKVFGCSIDPYRGKPTNSEYIAAVTNYYICVCAEGSGNE